MDAVSDRDYIIAFLEFAAVLEQHPFLERAYKMAYMEMTGGTVPGQDDFRHNDSSPSAVIKSCAFF
jgi:hypothetical protein